MIGPVTVRVSAAHPDVPLREVPVFRGSACTVGIEGVPAYFGGVAVTSVSVGIENAAGEVRAVAATRSGCMWVATIGADFFSAPGSVRNGLTVGAGGIEEDGVTAASWILGKGDVCIIDGDAVPAPGEDWNNVHLRDSVPSTPVKGDLAKVADVWKVFDGVAWRALGGSSVVESETNPGYAAHADAALSAPWSGIKGRPTTFAPSAHAATHATGGGDPLSVESIGGPFLKVDAAGNVDSLHAYGEVVAETKMQTTNVEAFASITKAGEEVATEAQLRVTMQLVGNDPYTVQLGGVVQTFDQVKRYAETRNAVIQRGQGTYRPTYIGENEMMWDVIGTVQGSVLTGQIHIWKDGDVVQRVEPKTLATEPMVDAVSTKVDEIGESVSVNNRILVADTTAAIQTRADEESDWADEVRIDKGYDAVQGTEMVKLDKSVQTVTVNGGALAVVFPDGVDGTVRDLCLYVNNTSSESTVEMTFPDGTYYGADGWDAAAQKGGITGYYFSEIPGNGWRVSREELNQFVKGA